MSDELVPVESDKSEAEGDRKREAIGVALKQIMRLQAKISAQEMMLSALLAVMSDADKDLKDKAIIALHKRRSHVRSPEVGQEIEALSRYLL